MSKHDSRENEFVRFRWEKEDSALVENWSAERLLEHVRYCSIVSGQALLAEVCKRYAQQEGVSYGK